ncbi:MAG: hypothetical protein ACQCXQ_10860 [Verrucomicrobiales bacterium]|nr:hypothetical protein [Verrucomicrobiota bacterium JB025]
MSAPHLLAAAFLAILACKVSAASFCFQPHVASPDGPRTWAFEIGVAAITDNNIEDFILNIPEIQREKGAAGGEIYTFTASRRLGEFHWEIGGRTFTPQVELPLTLEIVDENSHSPFPDFNASFFVRWIDFPWNHWVKTSFGMGVGLSYSSHIYLIDEVRHPGDDRSKLKINWPIQMTFAHPEYEDHQLMLFILHQSGGKMLDSGGVNSLGLGYRYDF